MAKGSEYERETCRKLSLWASQGKHDDWFWRASQSGGRATQRAKFGKRTIGHAGDIAATCPEGSVLTSLVTWELKRGYNKTTGPTLYSLLDKRPKSKAQTVELFIEQAKAAAKLARTPYWCVVHRLDGRDSIMLSDYKFFQHFMPIQYTNIRPRARFQIKGFGSMMVFRLDDFLANATPPKRRTK